MWLTGQLVRDHKTIGDFRKLSKTTMGFTQTKAAGDEIMDKDTAGDDSDPER